jgi:serine/threonine protein kinase
VQVARAAHFAHSRLLAHRDIKLDNILLFYTPHALTAKLADFGLASYCHENGHLKKFREVRGSEMYMAPEIWRAREDPEGYDAMKADVFALGVTLFAMVCGRMPFRRATNTDSLYFLIM